MGRRAKIPESEANQVYSVEERPDFTAAARERRLVGLAYDEAERRLKDGTASSEMICHFLRAGSNKEYLEQQILASKSELTKAKTEMYKAQQKSEEMLAVALTAFRSYTGDDEDV